MSKSWWIETMLELLRQLRREMGWHPIHRALVEVDEGIYDGMEK